MKPEKINNIKYLYLSIAFFFFHSCTIDFNPKKTVDAAFVGRWCGGEMGCSYSLDIDNNSYASWTKQGTSGCDHHEEGNIFQKGDKLILNKFHFEILLYPEQLNPPLILGLHCGDTSHFRMILQCTDWNCINSEITYYKE